MTAQETDPKIMIELLKEDRIQVVDESQHICKITHTNKGNTVYFWSGGFYASFNIKEDYDYLLKRLSTVIRIEKEFNSEYYPIWTKEDGVITQCENFVKLKDRYYTVTFLEQLIDKISEFKKINI